MEGQNSRIGFNDIFLKNSTGDVFVSLAWDMTHYRLTEDSLTSFVSINVAGQGISKEIMRKGYSQKLEYLKSDQMNGKLHFFTLLMAEMGGTIIGYGKGYPPSGNEYYVEVRTDEKEIKNVGPIINDYLVKEKPLDIFYYENGYLLSVINPMRYKDDEDFLKDIDVTKDDNPIILAFEL